MLTAGVDEVVDRLGQRDRNYSAAVPGESTSNEELLPTMCHWIDQHAERFFTGAPTRADHL